MPWPHADTPTQLAGIEKIVRAVQGAAVRRYGIATPPRRSQDIPPSVQSTMESWQYPDQPG